MKSDILVGISTYNDYKYTELLLQSIRWYTYKDDHKFEIVVCDDGTRSNAAGIPGIKDEAEETYEKLKNACKQFGATLIEHEANMGIPATWNHLANALGADSKYIVILNNDLIVPPNWLKVAMYFLEANYDNPHVGSCFWNPVNRVPYDAMRAMLPMLGHTLFTTQDQVRGFDLGHSMLNIDVGAERLFAVPHMNTRVGDGHGLGRVMCPCGCCFAMTRKVWEQCGPFREDLVSFHEESLFGTRCAEAGRAAFGFSYPRPYHTHGYTFSVNAELRAGERMRQSRKMYREIMNVPESVPDDKYFEWVHNRLMSQIPPTRLKYLVPNYSKDPVERRLPGGEIMLTPCLDEVEGEF